MVIVPSEFTKTFVPFTSSASWPPLVAATAAVGTADHWLKAAATKLLAGVALGKTGLRSPWSVVISDLSLGPDQGRARGARLKIGCAGDIPGTARARNYDEEEDHSRRQRQSGQKQSKAGNELSVSCKFSSSPLQAAFTPFHWPAEPPGRSRSEPRADFPPSTGSAWKAERCCADSKTRPQESTGKRPMAPATQLVSPNLLEVRKEKHSFAHTIALAAGPEPDPLRDRQILARSGSANRVLSTWKVMATVSTVGRGLQGVAQWR